MKTSGKSPIIMLAVLVSLIAASCQPAPRAIHSRVIPVISSSSDEENIDVVKTEIPPREEVTTTLNTSEKIAPQPTPTRVMRSTLPAAPPIENPGNCQPQGSLEIEEETLRLINLERSKNDLPPLLMNNLLVAAARHHSADMACHNYFNHTGIDGSSPFKRMNEAGYQMSYAGENIYAGPEENNTPAEAVRRWMNSSTHRNAILNQNYTEAGVGYYFYEQALYDGYFTIDFAAPEGFEGAKTQ